jgi:hypothetical protein
MGVEGGRAMIKTNLVALDVGLLLLIGGPAVHLHGHDCNIELI